MFVFTWRFLQWLFYKELWALLGSYVGFQWIESKKMGAELGILYVFCDFNACAAPLIIQARRPTCEYSNLNEPTGAGSDLRLGKKNKGGGVAKFDRLFGHGACFLSLLLLTRPLWRGNMFGTHRISPLPCYHRALPIF